MTKSGLIWAFMYSFQFGFLNRILFTLGLTQDPVNWTGNPDTALFAVTVPYIWRTLPFAIILVHAALQGIPRELYEQAAVDGARAWRRFWHVTLPLLRPVIVLMIPLYIVMRPLGQLNTLSGVIIAETGFLLPYAILILAPYFDSIPRELEEAARIDGCTRLRAFVFVILPLSTPALAACGVIMFIISWHELLIPLILNARPDVMTLPVVIASLVGDVHSSST